MNYLKALLGSDNEKSQLSFDSKPSLSVDQSQVSGKQADVVDSFTEIGTKIKSYITRFVPLEEGDCLSCKLIGVSVLWGAAGFVLIQGHKIRHRYTGFRKVALYIQITSLSSGVFVLGLARLLDKSIFDKNKGDKSIMDLALSDIQDLQNQFHHIQKKFTRQRPED